MADTEAVTRASAIAAIEHVAQNNCGSREREAEEMLVAAPAAVAGPSGYGPKVTVKRRCSDCKACNSESYAVQGDSGHYVYCEHPSLPERKYIGDTRWDTPGWCPAAAPTTQPALQPTQAWPIAPDVAADLERSDWTPEEALRWYAAGKHYDTVPNGDGSSSARILDNGAVASNALKSMSREYAEHKGDVALQEPSPTAGMNIAQRILHVGGRNPPGSTYVEFGSIQAVEALVKHVLRDLQPSPAAQGDALTQAARDVLAERQRQISAEGWTPEHDDEHLPGELSLAAASYVCADEGDAPPAIWPWDWSWWKPRDRRRNLVKSGALVLAELERVDRADAARAAQEGK